MGAPLTAWMLSGLLAFAPQAAEAVQAEPPAASDDSPVEAVSVPEALASPLEFSVFLEQFRRFCVSGFPDDASFHHRIEQSENGYVSWGEDADQQSQAWVNGPLRLQYQDRNAAVPVPTPQCFMSADIVPQGDHLTMARAMGEAMGIGSGKSSGRGGKNRTIWTVDTRAIVGLAGDDTDAGSPLDTAPQGGEDAPTADDKQTSRIIFLTQPVSDGTYRTRLIIMAID